MAALGLASCGSSASSYRLAGRSEPGVRTEEARITLLLERSRAVIVPPGRCRVRLLGRAGAASFVWAFCTYGRDSGVSVPLRIDGTRVTVPGDGSFYSPSVRRMFPRGLADLALAHDDKLRP
ncbi:MAG: hypothetical protein JWN46_3394 [Acidimicrobiales bacterium]|nr:hypothetical protein [Acidimicrobiales bacterium]